MLHLVNKPPLRSIMYAQKATSVAADCLSSFSESSSVFAMHVSWPKTKLQNLGTRNQLPSNPMSNENVVESVWITVNIQNIDQHETSCITQEWNNRLTHYFGLFWGFGAIFGVFSYFRCKIWRHILAQRLQFPVKVTKSSTSLTKFSRSDAGQTDRWQMQQPKQKALTL